MRLLTLGDSGTVNETLINYDASGMRYAYVINESALPVSNYAAMIDVKQWVKTSHKWCGMLILRVKIYLQHQQKVKMLLREQIQFMQYLRVV